MTLNSIRSTFTSRAPLASGVTARAARALAAFALFAPLAFGNPYARQSVDELVQTGRELLALGKASEAQKLFERAAETDAHALRTEQWVIRSWLAQDRINDAFNAIDALAKTNSGPELDYLYGMAFAANAQRHLKNGVNGQIIGMSFSDAVVYLQKATLANPALYKDAFAPLAEAAWYEQKLDVARAAGEQAVALEPQNADAAMTLGRIAMSQYVSAKDDAAQAVEADVHWETARASFAKAAELFSARGDVPAQTATAALQLGHTLAWKKKVDEAARAYALALSADPDVVDFGQVINVLAEPKDAFVKCLEEGARMRKEKSAGETRADATLAWWLGWARFENAQYAEADAALQTAVRLNPSFHNSWYYIAQARYAQKDYAGAVDAFGRHFEASPEDLAASIAPNSDIDLAILDYLVAWCANNERTVEAGLLSEAQTIVAPKVSRYWNNAGLFYRDAAERLMKSETAADQKTSAELIDKAYTAYSMALELSPTDPSILNDTAVMLHYYLKRDFDRARAMYLKAREIAEAELAKTDLAEDVRRIYAIALRDSKNNLAKLEREVAK